ncbi:hypothetical protein H4582DRAFT_2160070 [Lactarius indigo]|nr:hypothetical protein H4582DRAFT_2160070 [Lactarius indigo]
MTNWKSPSVVTAEYIALVKLCHVMAGILIWELVVNIGFEYSVLTGKRKFRSSFLIYLGAQWLPLFAMISILVGFDSANPINCKRLSSLTLLGISIWGLNKIAISVASIVWLVHTGFLIHSLAVLRATWSGGICKITNPSETRMNIPATFITDLVLLALMLIGLLRWENAHQRGGVWWLLYTQGLVWMIIVVVAEALIMVFILLNLNVITMTICASRMYRGLVDYFLNNEANVHISGGMSKPPISCLVPRSGQRSRALPLQTSGIPDGHIFGMDPLAPTKHHFRLGENNKVW